jgi:hypothetical protein
MKAMTISKWLVTLTLAGGLRAASPGMLSADLLVVGGNESAVACAVQAARLGVKRIVLVNDIAWLGGQFSAEAVGCLDEWTTYNGQRTNFPRSGMFLEIVNRIREFNTRTYGKPEPGNAFCGKQTIEPAAAAGIFEEFIAPYAAQGTGQITVVRGFEPMQVTCEGNRVARVDFRSTGPKRETVAVNALLTVDASDWGDVIRLSGAGYLCGPDLKARFNEPSAPATVSEAEHCEMNPISYCLVLREAGRDATIKPPSDYDPRKFAALDKTPPFVESDMSEGIYARSGWSVYTHRRLVDRWHNKFAAGTEKTLLNWPVQDYPLMDLPPRVVDALETDERGASRKNVAEMSPAQRRIVFEDAKRQALGMLYHLQTKVHDRVGDFPQSFRYMELTDEFGTDDRLPPKVYVREGLRLEALYMLKEQDIRAKDRNPRWAKFMAPDGVFGFQFNIDFHPTRRKFPDPESPDVWVYEHTKTRNWSTDTDRAMFPLRGLVPVGRDGLLGASKNIGVTSLVQSALRLHGQMMLCGQASGTVAALCLRDQIEPRALAADTRRVREVQRTLARGGAGKPGVLLWPYHDLRPDDAHFEAANMLSVLGIWMPETDGLDFQPTKVVTAIEFSQVLASLRAHGGPVLDWVADDSRSEAAATNRQLIGVMKAAGLAVPAGLSLKPDGTLVRATLVRGLWEAMQARD